jgi:soluble lytic murein transglycosylase-like protein
MRGNPVVAFFAVLSISAAAQSSPSSEFTAPEAVYYANAYADHYGVPRELVHAVIAQESGWNQRALSGKGAVGLMQLMPGTASRFSVENPTSIQDNIGGGVRYLAMLNDLFHGDLRMVVAAYYCGEHHILTSGLRYHNAEVIAYVGSVEKRYERELALHHPGNLKGTGQ